MKIYDLIIIDRFGNSANKMVESQRHLKKSVEESKSQMQKFSATCREAIASE